MYTQCMYSPTSFFPSTALAFSFATYCLLSELLMQQYGLALGHSRIAYLLPTFFLQIINLHFRLVHFFKQLSDRDLHGFVFFGMKLGETPPPPQIRVFWGKGHMFFFFGRKIYFLSFVGHNYFVVFIISKLTGFYSLTRSSFFSQK